MGNYRGYFRAFDNNDLFEVQLIGNTGTTAFTEVALAGSSPFVVRYDQSKTIYDPLRTSKATISIVNNSYMEDILTPYAHGTRVILKNLTMNTVEWVGFLTPKLYSQEYVREYEVIDLEAEDCLSTLQYFPYMDDTAHTRSIVTIKSIINRINDMCVLTTGYYWSRTKKVGNTILLPSQLKISEYNFYTTDTDECWKMDEVLSEICKYFGFTCLQWKDKLYFLDYQSYHNNDDVYCNWFSKASNYVNNTMTHVGDAKYVDKDSFKGSNATISFKPVYNKVVVNANMMTCEDFIPTPFNDVDLTNRRGGFYENFEVTVPTPYRPQYPYGSSWGSQNYKEDDDVDDIAKASGDTKYRYFQRLYDNKYWESVYYDPATFRTNPTEVSKEQMGAAWSAVSATSNYVGGTIVDLGVVRNEYYSEYYQHIVPSKLDYTRYLCASQCGKVGMAWTDAPILRLKSGYRAPCFVDTSKAYLVINYSAIWERYIERPYINPDWVNTQCKHGGTGASTWSDGDCYFRMKIGNKYWTGYGWVTASTTHAADSVFCVITERTEKKVGEWNKERKVLNNISWDMFVNEEGYKIPLAGVDLLQDIEFDVMMPTGQFIHQLGTGGVWDYTWNAYCWIKDLSIKCVQVGSDGEELDESDVTYENVIDEDAVSELGDITVKLTTSTDLAKPSYSHVIYDNGTTNSFLSTVKEDNIQNALAQKPEENIVQKYVQQYSSTTKQFFMTLNTNYTPFDVVNGIDVENTSKRFVQLSCEIDYKRRSQEIIFEEIK